MSAPWTTRIPAACEVHWLERGSVDLMDGPPSNLYRTGSDLQVKNQVIRDPKDYKWRETRDHNVYWRFM